MAEHVGLVTSVRNEHDGKKYMVSTLQNPMGLWETGIFESAGPLTMFRARYFTLTVPFRTDSPDVVSSPPTGLFDLRGNYELTHHWMCQMAQSDPPSDWVLRKQKIREKKRRTLALLDEFRDESVVGGYRMG